MVGSFHNPKLFGLWFGIVELIDHPGWHEVVLVAVDEEHGLVAAGHLFQGRGFLEVPSVLQLAKPTGGVQQWESRKSELAFQLFLELIPYAGIATVFYKTVDVRR